VSYACKDLATRFVTRLYLLLKRNYERIESATTRAPKRWTKEAFLHSIQSGGTAVSSALELMRRMMDELYPPTEWNIYGAPSP
jgi:uncharacterized protein